ncbi:phage tail terminator protein [Phytopseudomonas daroniae]|uniref:phage tail terminator protein n=1 Tax=Phytopseudomonas daroniae TaxID=2487519 RepID=UPI0010382F84|nr:hypothetical protein [Pseudomonas daroniae]TBU75200.1 hypothetical protein DNK10_11120 [Pseudomonas daroniae]
MSNAPLDTRLVIERLNMLEQLQTVGTAADYAAVKGLSSFRTPSAYALLSRENAMPNPAGNSTGRVRQMTESTFGVVIAVRNYRYSDTDAADALGPILDAVRGVIIGWSPPLPGARGCQFVAGQVLDSNDSTLLWAEVYATQHSIGSTS